MEKFFYKSLEITDLKDMLEKSGEVFYDRPAYRIRVEEGKYKVFTHGEVRRMVDALGTALISLGLKDKRIAVIGENRYEWEIAYLAIVCGTGIVVPLDKSLPANELENLIKRSEVEAIFFTSKYKDAIAKIKAKGDTNLKYIIQMDIDKDDRDIISEKELISKGEILLENDDRNFVDAVIDPNKMSIMLFTSGTTAASKIVALSHKNICTNLMDLGEVLDVNETDTVLSILPIHHVFECTVGFLLALYKGAETVFCDGIRHLVDNLYEYKVSVMACVPGIYERIFKIIRKKIEKDGKLEKILEDEEKYKNLTIEERKEKFKEIHDMLGGRIKLFISGAAALDRRIEEKYRLLGLNIVQGYGLTETSPVVAIGTNSYHRIGSVGRKLPSLDVKISNPNQDGIGEIIVKGPTVMLEYFGNKEATDEVMDGECFHTGDLGRMDEDGYLFICGRKKSVIVLKNGKNIFPEEMENLVNKIEDVEESMIFGMAKSDDEDDIKINAILVVNKNGLKEKYGIETDEEIYKVLYSKVKKINNVMPPYKAIKKLVITEKPLIKTTTNKIKRQANLDAIKK
ncbi:MAG: AMP-binding protein [Clostridia bacterium]|nr:AMP-binding protein [Clostridia bacterium]